MLRVKILSTVCNKSYQSWVWCDSGAMTDPWKISGLPTFDADGIPVPVDHRVLLCWYTWKKFVILQSNVY